MIPSAADEFVAVFLLLLLLLLLLVMSVKVDPAVAAGVSVSPPPSPPPYAAAAHFTPFKPSVAIAVALLTTAFSLTFLFLLYARHCKQSTTTTTPPAALSYSSNCNRKNSGVTRAVVDSLPVFRFGSLTGPKDGLECAVCLSRFEPSEILRLLPKCNHAFHVECVDTWLDAHSTCPLCRYRVDPEDILLLLHQRSIPSHDRRSLPDDSNNNNNNNNNVRTQRLSGRHSSAGERGAAKLLQIILQPQSSRRSLDSRTKPAEKKQEASSSSSAGAHQISNFFEKPRKDGMLLASVDDRQSFGKRFEHRIMISYHDEQQRWSDLQGSDLMYLRSEMIMNDSRRRYSSAEEEVENGSRSRRKEMGGGRIVINPRSVSEIGGVSRRDEYGGCNYENGRERRKRHVAGVLSRWLAWVSTSSQRSQLVDRSPPFLL